MADSRTSAHLWRRHSTREFTLLALLISLVVFLVHQTTLSRENAELPMDRVLAELEAHCQAPHDGGFDSSVSQLPPAFYGLGVWVDSPALLPGVHGALALMKERLTGSTAATFPPPTHSLHAFVRVQSKLRDAAVAALVAETRETGAVASLEEVTRQLELVASQQQLGMPTMKHAFLPQIGQEVELSGLSLFSVPAEVLPGGSKVQCFVADVRQAYCVFPFVTETVETDETDENVDIIEEGAQDEVNSSRSVDRTGSADSLEKKTQHKTAKPSSTTAASAITAASYRTHAATLDAEVRAALLSVMTRQMGLSSFKPADVAAWKQQREQQGCAYTVASVKSTLRSIAANTNMVIPLNTRHMFADLERYVEAKAFVRAARAADDLQFHPSLTPQLYIPWDHSLVSQLVILLPMVSMTILALRFVLDERRARRARAKAAAAVSANATAKEKKAQ